MQGARLRSQRPPGCGLPHRRVPGLAVALLAAGEAITYRKFLRGAPEEAAYNAAERLAREPRLYSCSSEASQARAVAGRAADVVCLPSPQPDGALRR